jgi:hypothetical protein
MDTVPPPSFVKNRYKPVTQRFDGSFHKFGPEMTKLLSAYPSENPIWYVIGEEFITSYKLVRSDAQLLDPWNRPFPDEMISKMVTVELPEKHVKIPTTVSGTLYMCNVYVRDLNQLEIDCNDCIGRNECIECNKTRRKIVVFPKMN